MSHPVVTVLTEEVARAMAALASPPRVALILVAAQVPRPVEALAGLTGLSPALVSHHLKALREAGLLQATRRGRATLHTLGTEAAPLVAAALAFAWAASPRLREVAGARYLADAFEPVSPQESLVLDVRVEEEFAWAHLPEAVSAPLTSLGDLPLPTDRSIVCHGRGRFCPLSDLAVRQLRARGLHAHRWAEGVIDWMASGRALVGSGGGEQGVHE